MPSKLRAARYRVSPACSDRCSLNPAVCGGTLATIVHQWYEDGLNDDTISTRGDAELNHHWSLGAIQRHRARHLYKVADVVVDVPLPEGVVVKDEDTRELDQIGVLMEIIRRGAKTLPHARITPEVTLKAMDMYFKLTQGKAIDNTINAIAKAMAGGVVGEEPGIEDNEDAVMTPEERVALLSGDIT